MKDYGEKYYFFQEGFKRAAMASKGIPDRVPLYGQICELITQETGIPASKIFRDPELLVTGSYNICEKYGIDVPVAAFDTYNIESEGIGQKLLFHEDIMPDIDRTSPLISDKKDLDRIVTPDFERDGRFSFVVKVYEIVEKLTGLPPALVFCGPFSMAANIRGIEKVIMDIMLDPGFATELFERVTHNVLIPWIQYLQKKFPDTPRIVGADALASLPIINEKIMEDYAVKYIQQIFKACGERICIPNHTGERYSKTPERFLEARLLCNPHFVQGQDPDIEQLGPEFYKEFANKHDLPLLLGLGATFLTQATPEQVHDRVKYYVEAGGKDGRFVFYLCNLEPGTPKENIKTAIDALHKYGTYEK